MKRHVMITKDPDDFWGKVDEVDNDGNIHMTLKEGELPPRFPKFTYKIVED